MRILAIISTVILALYLAIYFVRYKVIPPSLSETFYIIDIPYAFTAAMFCMVITIVAPMVEVAREGCRFLAFLCPVGIGFVGAAPFFKEEFDGSVHTAGAVISAISGLAWVIFGVGLWWTIPAWCVIILSLALITHSLKRSRIFWLEMTAFGSVFASLLVRVL